MAITDINSKYLEELEDAVSQWTRSEPQPMLDLIDQVMLDSFEDGYKHAIEVLNDTINGTTEKEGRYNGEY